jgi:hypothetical protein
VPLLNFSAAASPSPYAQRQRPYSARAPAATHFAISRVQSQLATARSHFASSHGSTELASAQSRAPTAPPFDLDNLVPPRPLPLEPKPPSAAHQRQPGPSVINRPLPARLRPSSAR